MKNEIRFKVETTYGTDPAGGEKITVIPMTAEAEPPIFGRLRTAIGFRFPCPCCGEMIVGEIVRTDDADVAPN